MVFCMFLTFLTFKIFTIFYFFQFILLQFILSDIHFPFGLNLFVKVQAQQLKYYGVFL